MKKRTAAVLAAFLIPYITTLAVSGRVQGVDRGKIGGNSDRTSGWESQTDGRQILLDREDGVRNNGTGYAVPLEEYLIGLTAVQIPDGYPKEQSRRRQFWRGRRCTGRWTGQIRSRNRR